MKEILTSPYIHASNIHVLAIQSISTSQKTKYATLVFYKVCIVLKRKCSCCSFPVSHQVKGVVTTVHVTPVLKAVPWTITAHLFEVCDVTGHCTVVNLFPICTISWSACFLYNAHIHVQHTMCVMYTLLLTFPNAVEFTVSPAR